MYEADAGPGPRPLLPKSASFTPIPGLGDKAMLLTNGTSPTVMVLVGRTYLKLDFTDGPAGGEKWLVPLARLAVAALTSSSTSTTGA